MKEWIISGWIHFVIGVAVGWLLIKQPEWAKQIVYSIWEKIKSIFKR